MRTRAIHKQAFNVTALLLLAVTLIGATGSGESEINRLTVENDGTHTVVNIATSGNVRFTDFRLDNPPRIVVDCIGAVHRLGQKSYPVEDSNVKGVRTSQYANEPATVARIVIDLSNDAGYQASRVGDVFKVKIGADIAEGRVAKAPSEEYLKPAMSSAKGRTSTNAPEPAALPPAVVAMTRPVTWTETPAEEPSGQEASPEPATMPEPVEEAGASSDVTALDKPSAPTPTAVSSAQAEPQGGERKGTWNQTSWLPPAGKAEAPPTSPEAEAGMEMAAKSWAAPAPAWTAPKPVAPMASAASSKIIRSLDVQGADIRTVLRNLSEFADVNIVASPEVQGEVYVHLSNVPWEEALETILKAHGFDYREDFGILRVGNSQTLRKEELEAQAAVKKKEDLIPLSVGIVPIRFANAREVSKALVNVVSKRGRIDVDDRSNSLIVTDIERKIAEVETMVASIDLKPKQVEIVSKLVDVDAVQLRELGINWNLLNVQASGNNATGNVGVDAPIGQAVGTLQFGTVQSWGQLVATLEALEKRNEAHVISNPKITTLDNRKARIMVGQEIPLIVSDEAGNPITELVKIGIILETTPHVNGDNSITLDLLPEVSDLSSEATVQGGVIINSSQADTRVIVENGQTAVIGGLIKSNDLKTEVGVPILMDIPILGYLFRSESTSNRDRELIIFVTPTIVDNPKAGDLRDG